MRDEGREEGKVVCNEEQDVEEEWEGKGVKEL